MFAQNEGVVDSGGTSPMIKDVRIISPSRKKVATTVTTAGESLVKVEFEGGATVLLSGG